MGQKQPVMITGIGLLSSLGEGPENHWDALQAGKPQNIDTERFAPYPVHALGEVDWATQISRRDKRQMEPWQQIGTYAAGLALDDAKAKGDEELCGRMDMIVAAGGGERDIEVDSSIMAAARQTNDRESMVAESLSSDLRPTLFLAQLSNLLAGNISIVHKVTGSSRTFMGEEGAGISAIRTAHARIESGQSDIVLVGGAYNGEREDMILVFELGQYVAPGDWGTVWERAQREQSGFSQGSVGAFMVLESAAHAKKRGITPYAQLTAVSADHGPRDAAATNERMKSALEALPVNGTLNVLSGASGVTAATEIEQEFLNSEIPEAAVRGYGTMAGHSIEAHFPFGVAMAALAAKNKKFYPAFDASEKSDAGTSEQILVTTLGHWRSEGFALVEPAGE